MKVVQIDGWRVLVKVSGCCVIFLVEIFHFGVVAVIFGRNHNTKVVTGQGARASHGAIIMPGSKFLSGEEKFRSTFSFSQIIENRVRHSLSNKQQHRYDASSPSFSRNFLSLSSLLYSLSTTASANHHPSRIRLRQFQSHTKSLHNN